MENKVLMPRELTAENGAKYLLNGEFSVDVEVPCTCGDRDLNDDPSCAECNDSGYIIIPQTIPWTTIKEIYAKAVKHLAK